MPGGHDLSPGGLSETITRCVNSDTTRSSTTAAIQGDMSVSLGLGAYVFNYYLIAQSAATTTGHKFSVNFTGTKGIFAYNLRWVTNVSASSDDVAAQAYTTAAAAVVSAYTARAPTNAGTGVITDVDVINADVMYVLEGILTVTAVGSLDLYWAPEAAANATLKAGSSLILWKTG
jgi:hypothetical protein